MRFFSSQYGEQKAHTYDKSIHASHQQRLVNRAIPARMRHLLQAIQMGDSRRHYWLRAVVAVGIGYALIGIVFTVPTTHIRAWRIAAWVVSGVGYAAHIAYERIRDAGQANANLSEASCSLILRLWTD